MLALTDGKRRESVQYLNTLKWRSSEGGIETRFIQSHEMRRRGLRVTYPESFDASRHCSGSCAEMLAGGNSRDKVEKG